MKTIKKNIIVSKNLAHKIQKCIDDNVRFDDQISKNERIIGWTFHFGTIEADIIVYDGDNGPWIDAYLVDDGNEAVLLEPQYTLLGDYEFEYKGIKYITNLKAG